MIAQGEDIPFEKTTTGHKKGSSKSDNIATIVKICSNINAAAKKLLEADVEYIVLHLDSWMLNQEKLIGLVELLKKKNKKIEIHDLNFRYTEAIGSKKIMSFTDFLYIINKKFCVRNNIFDFEPLSMLPQEFHNMHEIYLYQILVKISLANSLCYSSEKNFRYFDKKKVIKYGGMFPAVIDIVYDQIHVHVGAFYEDLGKHIQASFLRQFKIKGEYVEKFISKWRLSDEEIIRKIQEQEKKDKKRLKKYFTNYKTIGFMRSYKAMNEYLDTTNYFSVLRRVIYNKIIDKKNRKLDIVGNAKKTIKKGHYEEHQF